MLEVKEDRWFGRLDDSPRVKWMRRVYPRVDYTQAPWTVVMLRQPSQSIHTFKGGIDLSPVGSLSICLIVGSSPYWRQSRSGITICNKYTSEFDST